jgi:hypothetical protein
MTDPVKIDAEKSPGFPAKPVRWQFRALAQPKPDLIGGRVTEDCGTWVSTTLGRSYTVAAPTFASADTKVGEARIS